MRSSTLARLHRLELIKVGFAKHEGMRLYYSLSQSTRHYKTTGMQENDRADESERIPHLVLLRPADFLVLCHSSPSFPASSRFSLLHHSVRICHRSCTDAGRLLSEQLDLRDSAEEVGEERLVERAVEEVLPDARRRVNDLEREGIDLGPDRSARSLRGRKGDGRGSAELPVKSC